MWRYHCRARKARAILALVAVASTFAGAVPLFAQAPKQAAASDAEADALGAAKDEASQLAQVKNFADAIAPAERVLALSERIFGHDAEETATAAHNLGFLLRRANRPADAQPHLERALSIYQRMLPAVHEDMRNIAGELGNIYIANGRSGDVIAIYQGLIARADTEGYGRHVGNGHLYSNLGFLLVREKREAEARSAWERALEIYEADATPKGDAYRLIVDALLDAYWAAGEEGKARAFVEDRLRIAGAGAQGETAAGSRLLLRLGGLEHSAANYHQSRDLALRALKLADPDGKAKGSRTADALNSLARAEKALANYDAAEGYFTRALAALDDEKQVATAGIITDNLATLYSAMGRLAEAEKHHKRALQLLEAALGREHRSVGQSAANLGALLSEQGRLAEAEPFLKRGLEIAEKQKPQDAVLIAVISDNLAGVMRQDGRREEALHLLERALRLFESSLPANHPSLATMRNNLGRYYLDVGRHAEAEAQLIKGLEIGRAVLGGAHPSIATAETNLSELYLETGRKGEARPLIAHAIGVLEARFGSKHARLVTPLVQLGRLELQEGQAGKAVPAYQRAVDIELARRAVTGQGATSDSGDENPVGRQAFAGLLEALWQSGEAAGKRDVARSLPIGEWETITPATAALAAQAARMGSGDAKLGVRVRERQDLAAEWMLKDKRLTEMLAQGGERDTGLETSLNARLKAIEARIAEIDRELGSSYPRHGALARPVPLGIEEARNLLSANEAALQYVVTKDASYLWAITKSDARWVRIPAKEAELRQLVRALRCGLDQSEWRRDDGRGCNRLLGSDGQESPLQTGYALPFNLERAHGLYKILIEPVRDVIAGKDLIISTSGPLSALPFQVLVTAKGEAAAGTAPDYVHAAWLVRDHAISVIPSLSSLKALRKFALASKASEPFMGFGNPLLSGSGGDDKRAWDKQTCDVGSPSRAPQVASNSTVEAFSSLFRGGLGNVGMLKRQPPLPETADELCTVARLSGAKPERVMLGSSATEARIKEMSARGELAKARVLHFATHGLLAGETAYFVDSGAEPALLLTPPDEATRDDDGLLTATEVADLKLDADWVVLSACNTAAGDRAGSEALSGLARGFLYAGARTLLVSHWAVDSDATVKLVTGGFTILARDARQGRAEAMRLAMLGLIEKGDQLAHPANWSPFVVVGEGGTPRAAIKSAPTKRGVDAAPKLRDLFGN